MKMPKLKYRGTIMVDIDGVLADWETPMCDAFGYQNRHMYSPYDRYPDVPRDLIAEFIANPYNYEDLEPIFGGILFCHQARSRGWSVLLCTSRPESLMYVTENWLSKYKVPYNELVFSKKKADAILDYNEENPDEEVRIAVDDSVSVLRTLPTNVYPVAWLQEWNVGYYPRMWYSENDMKIMIKDAPENFPVGAWDIVGKR
jgi:hypothetical protein